jgi:O-antigen/teichoic acid export membrane protein
VWILASTVIGAAGGGLFWLAAARSASATDVGVATALFSSVTFVNYVTGLGLPITVARYGGSTAPEDRVIFNWAVAATTASALVVSAVYLPLVGDRADALFGWGRVPGILCFAAAAAGSAVGQLVDMRLTVQRRWHWVTVRVALYCLMRFPLLVVVPRDSALALFVLAAGLPALAGAATWWFADSGRGHFRLRPVPPVARHAVRYSGVNYLSQLAVQAPMFVLPVMVLVEVPPSENAVFFIAWSIATTVFLLPVNVVKVLLAEGKHGAALAHQSRISLGVNGAIGVVATVGAVVGAEVVSSIYGSGYADAADLLPLLVSAVLPWAVTLVALTHARIVDDEPATFVLSGLFAGAVLIPSFVLVQSSGAMGAAQGWFAGNCVTAVACAVWLVRRLRADDREPAGEKDV